MRVSPQPRHNSPIIGPKDGHPIMLVDVAVGILRRGHTTVFLDVLLHCTVRCRGQCCQCRFQVCSNAASCSPNFSNLTNPIFERSTIRATVRVHSFHIELQNAKSGETTVYSQCSCSRTSSTMFTVVFLNALLGVFTILSDKVVNLFLSLFATTHCAIKQHFCSYCD